MSGHRRPRAAHRRRPPRRLPRAAVAVALLGVVTLAAVLVSHLGPAEAAVTRPGADQLGYALPSSPPPTPVTPPTGPTPTGPTPQPTVTPVVTALHVPFPTSGPGTFVYATTAGPVLGTAGPVRRFRVALESDIAVVSLAELTATIDETLGDPRSWIAGGSYRLQRVAAGQPALFTIYLVTEKTSEKMCAPLYTGGYTSCRQGSHVVLNLDRWMTSVPGYVGLGVPLETYRTYMVNHEVGHALGNSHQLCPDRGDLAPVMEQQTLGLHGCTPNPWPYVDGKAYRGPPGQYQH